MSTPQSSYTYRDCSDQYDAHQVDLTVIEGTPARHGANIPHDKAHCRVGYDMPTSKNLYFPGGAGSLAGAGIGLLLGGPFGALLGALGGFAIGEAVGTTRGFQLKSIFPHEGSEKLEPRDVLSTTYYGTYRFEAQLTIKTDCINNFAYLDSFALRHLLNRDASVGKDNVVVTFELNEEIKNAGGAIVGINRDQHAGFFNSAKKLIIGYSYFSQDERGEGIYKHNRIVKKQKDDEPKASADKDKQPPTFTKLFTTEEGDLNFNFQKNHPAIVKTEHRY